MPGCIAELSQQRKPRVHHLPDNDKERNSPGAASNNISLHSLEVKLVHAESDHARDFNQHLIPEFEQSSTDDLHLVLLLKDIKRSI
jgi:hypothetical protein